MLTENLLTEEQVSEILSLSIRTLQGWRCRKRGPAYFKIGRTIFYDKSDISAYINAQKHETTVKKNRAA